MKQNDKYSMLLPYKYYRMAASRNAWKKLDENYTSKLQCPIPHAACSRPLLGIAGEESIKLINDTLLRASTRGETCVDWQVKILIR